MSTPHIGRCTVSWQGQRLFGNAESEHDKRSPDFERRLVESSVAELFVGWNSCTSVKLEDLV